MITSDFNGIWWIRDGKDTSDELKTNLQHRIKHHSPTGFNVGYGGSGPADFALNIVNKRLEMLHYRGKKTYDTWNQAWMYRDAWDIYQDFKREFLVQADPLQGRISWSDVDTFLTSCNNENIVKFMKKRQNDA